MIRFPCRTRIKPDLRYCGIVNRASGRRTETERYARICSRSRCGEIPEARAQMPFAGDTDKPEQVGKTEQPAAIIVVRSFGNYRQRRRKIGAIMRPMAPAPRKIAQSICAVMSASAPPMMKTIVIMNTGRRPKRCSARRPATAAGRHRKRQDTQLRYRDLADRKAKLLIQK